MSVVQPLLNASDFAVCEAERIDAPGATQGHGALFVLSRDSLRLTHSALAGAWGAVLRESIHPGMDAPALVKVCGMDVDLPTLCDHILSAGCVRAQPVQIASDAEATWFLSLGATHFILERRPEPETSPGQAAESWLERFPAAVDSGVRNIFALSQTVADEVRGLLGFDRVMVYRFAPDSTGEVIAESRASDMPPYLGLRYPATDIPSQARRLYLEHRIREIVDTSATAISLEPPGSASAGSPVDLSTSILRAISPYHLEYMSNMGVRATLVASIVIDGALWGLLACHHRAPRLVAASQRRAVLIAATAFGDRIDEIFRQAEARRLAQIGSALASIARAAAASGNFAAMLLETTIDMMSADGAALIAGDDIVVVGRAPSARALPAIGRALAEAAIDGVFVSDRLALLAHGDDLDFGPACGAAGIIIPGSAPVMLAAFREEYLRSVSWGGDPARPAHIDPNTGVLSPRQSFAAWRQTVTGCSRPWEDLALGFLTALSEGLSGSTLGDTPLTGARARLTADMRVVSDDLVYREELGNVVMNVAMDGIAIAVLAESENIVRIVSGNRAFTRLFDLDPEECRGTPISALTARLGLKTPWQSLPGEAEIVLWSETHGPRNIALMRRSVLDTVIDGARKIWEIRVFQDVTRMRRREEALSVAFERALGEARGKSEFLANISHELRTPLNAVLGYAEIIAGQMLGPGHAKYSEYATDIHSAGAHLLALIDRLLTVSEIEAEKRVLRETRFDLGELAAECAAWVAEQPGFPKPPIVVSLPRGAVWIIADAVAMHQVAINLIGNAAKFTPASGHVDVTVTLDPANAPVLSVKDDGPGVAQELIGELFQPFRQGEGVYSRRHGGVGLGLSIVKGLVQLHGGVVRMTSQPGQGAEFIVRLPPSRRA